MNNISQDHPASLHTPYILVVEDDPDDQILLKIAFDRIAENIALHFVSTAKEALEYLQKSSEHKLPHLIVTEFNLPGYNGAQLIQKLNTYKRYKGIKKVMLCDCCYPPATESKTAKPNDCFFKQDTYKGIIQLAEELLHLCSESVT